MDFFTSDQHINHVKILTLGNGRPFPDIETMNETIIAKWNARVSPLDRVFSLGDFIMRDRTITPQFRNRLNGTIFMVWGNHDNPRIQKDMFDWVGKRFELDTPHGRILMRHQPNNLELWDKSAHDVIEGEPGFDWFFCGHVHDRFKRVGNVINVGVDVRDWEPKTLDELLAE